MKACGGAAVRAGPHAASLPCPPRPHLLQHRLLREVELLEPVILVVAGGVQVVRVHLGRGGQRSGPAGPPGEAWGRLGLRGGGRGRAGRRRTDAGDSPGLPCSFCWSPPGGPTRRPPSAPSAPAAALPEGAVQREDRGPARPTHPQAHPVLTLQELLQLLCIGPLLQVLHQGVGHARQMAHVAFPRAPCGPGERETRAGLRLRRPPPAPAATPALAQDPLLTARGRSPPRRSGCAPPGGSAAAAVGVGWRAVGVSTARLPCSAIRGPLSLHSKPQSHAACLPLQLRPEARATPRKAPPGAGAIALGEPFLVPKDNHCP